MRPQAQCANYQQLEKIANRSEILRQICVPISELFTDHTMELLEEIFPIRREIIFGRQ